MLSIWTVFQLPQAYENILKHPGLTHIENEEHEWCSWAPNLPLRVSLCLSVQKNQLLLCANVRLNCESTKGAIMMAWYHAKLWARLKSRGGHAPALLYGMIFISLMNSSPDHMHRYTQKNTQQCAHPHYSGSLQKAWIIISPFIFVAVIESPLEIKAVSDIFPGTWVGCTCQAALSFLSLTGFCLQKLMQWWSCLNWI